MGVLAAFIFAGQMMNFPVSGGTSGHLLGGCLAAILIGPWAAILVMAMVIGTQAIIFQDGGLAVLGANIFNMGVITAVIGFLAYRAAATLSGYNRTVVLVASFSAAWVAVMVAAFATSAELALSGTSDWDVVLPAMLGVHALIGIGEGLITAGTVAFVLSTRPDLLRAPAPQAAQLGAEGVS
jgi:cobalt/nickel transport system permease protein